MGYWLVMAIVGIAVVAVLIAVAAIEEPRESPREPAGRPIWVAIGTNGTPPGEVGQPPAPHWVDLVREALGERAVGHDLTAAGCTAEEAQRNQLAAALAASPAVVAILLGPDDFRDAEDLGVFERRLWHILTTLRDVGSIPVMAALPDLTRLPSIVAEDEPDVLAEELQSWNVAIARLVAAADGELVAVDGPASDPDADWFTERDGRFILTAVGQRRLASPMQASVERLLGLSEAAPSPAPHDESRSDAE